MRWLIRNWHLKLGALALSVILYTGFVFSGSFSEQTFPGVAVTALNQPTGTYLLTQNLGTVDIRYRLSADAPQRVTAESFAVTVDLAAYDLEAPATVQSLPVVVRPLSAGLDVLTYAPASVSVSLDRLGQRTIAVRVDRGDVPDGLEIGIPQASEQQVTASGPESRLGRVDRALARVHIDESGIDVNTTVELVPVDVDGRPVESVELTPSTVIVHVDVRTVAGSKTVPVHPNLVGTPANGFEIASVRVSPAVISLHGAPTDLASVTEIGTASVSLTGATDDVVDEVELVLPPGISLSEAVEPTVSVTVTIRPVIASRTFVVGISCIGAPTGGACLPSVSQMSVTIEGNQADLDALTPSQLLPVIDVSGLSPGSYTLAPELSLPDGLTLLALSPEQVSVEVVGPSPAP